MSGLFQILDKCGGLGPIVRLVKFGIFPIIQIGIPIILIVMGSIDLGKAVMSSDEKKVKEAQGMLIKRVISAVIVFLMVTIVNIVFGLFGNAGIAGDEQNQVSNTTSWWDCWADLGANN